MEEKINEYLDHDAGEGEHDDDHDEADQEPRLGLEPVTEESVENEESHVGNH